MKFTFDWQVVKGNPHEGIQYHHMCCVYNSDMSEYYGIITIVFAEKWPTSYYDQVRLSRNIKYGFRYTERVETVEFEADRGKLNPATLSHRWRLSRAVPDGTGAFWYRARVLAQNETERVILATI